jgi:hypothetical protein
LKEFISEGLVVSDGDGEVVTFLGLEVFEQGERPFGLAIDHDKDLGTWKIGGVGSGCDGVSESGAHREAGDTQAGAGNTGLFEDPFGICVWKEERVVAGPIPDGVDGDGIGDDGEEVGF